jgi:odorant receptor
MFIAACSVSMPQIFTICFSADRLSHASKGIAEATYDNDWLEKDQKMKKALQMVIMRAQRPQHLKAFLFGKVTLMTFAALLRASHSYYGVLKATSTA